MNRLAKVRSKMIKQNLAAMIITNPFNLTYLSDFEGLPGDGCMVITANQAILITDSRYDLEMHEKLKDSLITLNITKSGYYKTAVDELANVDGAIGFEDSISFEIYKRLKQSLADQLVATHFLIEELRYVKDDSEIDTLRHSCELASDAYQAVLNYVHAGLTEKDIKQFIYDYMIEHGAEEPSFDTIVVSGARAALPHGTASDKVIQNGEMVTIDFGFYYHHYTSDMTRTFAVGDPGAKMKEIYQIVQTAQTKMIDAMVDGQKQVVIDAAARDYINDQGYGKYFNHGSGHEIGLDIHEQPIINPSSTGTVAPGYVLTAEPGIYLPNKGGVRIEDDILVTVSDPERLTLAKRDLIII